jgi:hypothetical protein
MPGYFYCRHCDKRTRKNPRIKTLQFYCGSQSCQQARKNLWERESLKDNPSYYNQRKSQKERWRKNRPIHQYQKEYRDSHPVYAETNREKQHLRNEKAKKIAFETLHKKIVKTDTLISESPGGRGLYEILPYKTRPGEKIVKTDALIVEIRAHRGFAKVLVPQSG